MEMMRGALQRTDYSCAGRQNAITILPWVVSSFATIPDALRKVMDQTVFRRYTDFSKGIVDFGNLVFFVATTIVFLFLTTKVLESRRWK